MVSGGSNERNMTMKKMTFKDGDLIRMAKAVARRRRTSPDVHSGDVGCALLTSGGNVYTGVCIDAASGIGFCAEHSAIAAMVTAGESRIERIVAVYYKGTILPPCGRCREFIYQIDHANKDTAVIVGRNRKARLKSLLPFRWQESF
jgi:cytidine deaminase